MKIGIGLIVHDRLEELEQWYYHHRQFAELIVVADRPSEEELSFLKSADVRLIIDDRGYQTIRLRDQYLQEAKCLEVDWLLRQDVDERISFEAGYQLRQIAEEAEEHGINFVEFNATDVVEQLNLTTRFAETDFYCPNFFKVTPDARYVGSHHEGVDLGVPQQHAQVPFKYYHIRSEASVILRGARNYFSTPRTTACTSDDPSWAGFKKLCVDQGVEHFSQLAEMMKAGNIDKSFKDWFVYNRNSANCEARGYFNTYFVLLHPSENTYYAGNVDFDFDTDRKPYPKELTF